MRIVVLEHIPEDPELRRAWNELVLRMEHPEVFYTYEWAIAVQRAYEGTVGPLLVLGYEGELLAGVAALARKSASNVAFLTADTGDYCDFLAAPGIRAEFIEAVFSELNSRNIGNVVLTNLPADSASVEAIARVGSRSGYHLQTRPAYECAQVRLGSANERAQLKEVVLAKKRLRRNMREMSKRGAVTLRHDKDWVRIQPLLPAFRRAHVARFLETGKISNLLREERRVFVEELARELSGAGWVVFSRLMIGDVTAAWHYGFRFSGSWFWYQPTVNDAFGDFSPGYCLLAKIVEEACDSPDLSLVDLGLGAEGYKERFTNASRRTLYCEMNQSLTRHWRTVLRYRAAALAMGSPAIEKRIRAAVSFVGEIRQNVKARGLGGTISGLARRIRRPIFSSDKVLFFEWPPERKAPAPAGTHLQALDSGLLGAAAVQYKDDPSSLRFLMRSAQRLRSGHGEGFVLVTAEGMPVHFCWVRDFEGFQMAELDRRLSSPCAGALMIFDCFTPESARGHGFFPEAIAALAGTLSSRGRSVWIFGAETNQASLHGIRKTGFLHKFTLGRRRVLFVQSLADSVPEMLADRVETTVMGS